MLFWINFTVTFVLILASLLVPWESFLPPKAVFFNDVGWSYGENIKSTRTQKRENNSYKKACGVATKTTEQQKQKRQPRKRENNKHKKDCGAATKTTNEQKQTDNHDNEPGMPRTPRPPRTPIVWNTFSIAQKKGRRWSPPKGAFNWIRRHPFEDGQAYETIKAKIPPGSRLSFAYGPCALRRPILKTRIQITLRGFFVIRRESFSKNLQNWTFEFRLQFWINFWTICIQMLSHFGALNR